MEQEYQGYSVSLSSDGTTLAVGAFGHDSDKGTVRIYTYNGTAWTQQGSDLDGAAASDQQGWSVSLSSDGTTLAVGAWGHDSNKGTVRIYTYNGTAWIQQVSDLDGEAGDQQGRSVSLSSDGTNLAVGANRHDSYKGTVRVYNLIRIIVTLTSSATSISEPTNSATLTATLDNTSSADVVVNLTYTGTATNATDYSGAASITISAGSLTGTTAITAIDDTIDEPLETIIIDIGSVSGGTENGTQQVSINLVDNDEPQISLSSNVNSISENEEESVITATLTNTKSFDVTVPFTLSGTATLDSDYFTDFTNKGEVKTVAGGNGYGNSQNQLYNPYGVTVDSSGNVYVADHSNRRIMKWAPGATEGISIITGIYAYGIHVDGSGNIYIADENNHRVMKWESGAVTGILVAGGNGQGANLNQLYNPMDVDGTILISYIADRANHRIMKWGSTYSDGGTLVAGTGVSGSENNQLYVPYALDGQFR